MKEFPDLLQRFLLTEAVKPSDDIFAALHGAFWTSGVLLYVPKGVKLNAPLFSSIGLTDEGQVDLNHTLVVLEEGSAAALVQESTGCGSASQPLLHVGAVELVLRTGPASVCKYPELE